MNIHTPIEEAVRLGTIAYIESRRQQITPFVDRHFSFQGAWQINKKAIGWDMLRAPANMLWMPVYFLGNVVGGKTTRLMGMTQTAEKLAKLPAGLRTDVERELEWLLYSEFLELPFASGERSCTKNAWLEAILTQPAFLELLEDVLRPIADQKDNPLFRKQLEEKLSVYIDNRKDVAEMASTLIAAAAGLAAYKQVNVGSIGLGQAVATSIAYQIAVSNFFLGPTLGGAFYTLFPSAAAASTGLVVGVTGGVAAIVGIVAAFVGVITDPAQRALGWHQKKLESLVTALEKQLTESGEHSLGYRDNLVTRMLDIVDMIIHLSHK